MKSWLAGQTTVDTATKDAVDLCTAAVVSNEAAVAAVEAAVALVETAVIASGGIPAGATRVGWKVDEGDAATVYTVPADTLLTITHISLSVAATVSENGQAALSTTDDGEICGVCFGAAGGANTLNWSGLNIQLAAAKVLSWARVNSPVVRISIRGYTESTA